MLAFSSFQFTIYMTYFGFFQYMTCSIQGLINVKIVLNKATDAIQIQNLIFA